MHKRQMGEAGFGVVEAIVIIIIVVLLAVGGWVVYQNHHKSAKTTPATTKTTKSSTKNASTDPYAGWKTGTLQYEKVSYRYPAGWTVSDLSKPSNENDGCVTPGFDDVTLTNAASHQISLHTGVDCIGDGGAKAFATVPVTALGQNLYLAIENSSGGGDSDPTAPAFACLAQTATPDSIFAGPSKNITSSASAPVNKFCYYPFDEGNVDTVPTTTVNALESSADFKTAKLVFESMQYN